jgi:hypothetical protein
MAYKVIFAPTAIARLEDIVRYNYQVSSASWHTVAKKSQRRLLIGGSSLGFMETSLQQMTKFFYRDSGVFDYSAHRQRVHRIVTRYGDEM